jgi:O-methyltransferase
MKIKYVIKGILRKLGILTIGRMAQIDHQPKFIPPLEEDYVRLTTLELVAHEIQRKNIEGSVAELGVYRGDFARHLNLLFPDKTLYLFDTFEGFTEKDKKIERDLSFSDVNQDFSDTSIEYVLNRMSNREKVVIKKGYFPESIGGLDDRFCFISIDADLYQPTYEGLKYFYSRLNHGGYIFIHDYNFTKYPGVKSAVDKFAEEQQIGIIPLIDCNGSAIISK